MKVKNTENLVSLENVFKSFNQNKVLKGVSLDLNKYEVISIIGGNGAGKSTLMKILTGVYSVDNGFVKIKGKEMQNHTPSIALEIGIYLVPQEPLLFPNMTVEQNINFGYDKPKHVIREEAKRICSELDWEIDLSRMAASLTIAEQQQLEIIKGLVRQAKILVLDEPTSALTFSETKSLFTVIEKLKKEGVGIFYITHRLDEVFEISTHAVILRDGKVTLKEEIEDVTKDMLIQGLLPDGSDTGYSSTYEKNYVDHTGKPPVLKVENLTGDGFRDINFEVYQGEVVGLAGLVGAGRTEIAEAIYGITSSHSGKVKLGDKDITHMGINETVGNGLSYIPEDRFLHGIFSIGSVKNNLTAQILKNQGFFVNRKEEKIVTKKYVERLRIKLADTEQEIKSLSGGNQQKVVISRILSTNPHLIIMDEPTRGIDAAARSDIYSIITDLKNIGFSILLISSDLEEIELISNRIYGIYRGVCNAHLGPEEINATNVMKAAFGTYERSDSHVKA
ncbi:AI-2 transport system ATP-binding protein [Virgibacillus halotolerans]|uniref:sugar ABC transporter ATP-binding protein n=1 Tax=Virgibacillus halotolerans TaxID=1071053 RepID=UPI0019615A31|nr:sugar ABC transporter ATP-binding protein [Virgibacillus halotolerans]MBM7599006.1 AI-2 transport system ATP-binding protein [Virgibacillus halotolerans]